ncbi:MAG: PhoU domain-containing protein, partial [Bacillota bacterium]|nr:PhoU domain-containing protein [Bacillota bacterium]
EIYQCFDKGSKMVNDSIEALSTGDMTLARKVKEQEKGMNELENDLRMKHMERLNRRQCSPEFTVIYTDVIHNIEKIGDSCDNIANVVLDNVNLKAAAERNKEQKAEE